MKRMLAMISVAAVALCGCGGASTEEGKDVAQAPNEHHALLDSVQQPLQRAQGVEDIAAGRKGDLDKQIEGEEK